jgi:hypothetical protein
VHASLILPGLYQSEYTPYLTWGDVLITMYGMPVAQHGLTIQWPIDDLWLPDVDRLHQLAELGASLVRGGSSVVVMCERGMNRSGLVTALIVRELEGLSGADAVALVRARRAGALKNLDFVNYLETLPALDVAPAAGDQIRLVRSAP